jgi:light-regulated signal transduction histidine kinase (bacteriophytochrome)
MSPLFARTLPYSTRTAAELFGEFFSSTLSDMETRRALNLRDTSVRLHDSLIGQVASGTGFSTISTPLPRSFVKRSRDDGVVAYVGGEFRTQGQTPDARISSKSPVS